MTVVSDDLINLRADLYCDLSLTLAGRRAEAEAAAAKAMALYERKGNLVELASIRRSQSAIHPRTGG